MSSLGGRRAIMIALILSTCGAGAPGAYAQSWAEHWFDNVTYTSPGSFEDQARGYVTAGGFSGRVDVHNEDQRAIGTPFVG
jgi:conjugative transfer pilus assembly protein TraH